MRSEVAGDVISGMALKYVVTDVPVSFGDSRLYSGQIIQFFVRPDIYGHVLHTFVQYLIEFWSRAEEASDIISGRFVFDKCKIL